MRPRVHSELLPTGTATFMFTDVEGSTRSLHDIGEDRSRDLLEAHYEVLRGPVRRHRGIEVATDGDSFFECSSIRWPLPTPRSTFNLG